MPFPPPAEEAPGTPPVESPLPETSPPEPPKAGDQLPAEQLPAELPAEPPVQLPSELPAEPPPAPPQQAEPPAAEQKVPSLMPEENPFKDEEPGDREPPPTPPKQSRNTLRGSKEWGQQAGFRWRAADRPQVSMAAVEQEETEQPLGRAPERLPETKAEPVERAPERLPEKKAEPLGQAPQRAPTAGNTSRDRLSDTAASRSNPLRSSAGRDAGVVPAASWASEKPAAPARPPAARSNPLRSN